MSINKGRYIFRGAKMTSRSHKVMRHVYGHWPKRFHSMDLSKTVVTHVTRRSIRQAEAMGAWTSIKMILPRRQGGLPTYLPTKRCRFGVETLVPVQLQPLIWWTHFQQRNLKSLRQQSQVWKWQKSHESDMGPTRSQKIQDWQLSQQAQRLWCTTAHDTAYSRAHMITNKYTGSGIMIPNTSHYNY